MDDINNASVWSEIEANNSAPMPNMAPVKRFWDRINATVTSAGTSPHYTYTPTDTAFPTVYVQGETYSFKASFTSAGGDDLNVNALGAKPLYKPSLGGPIPIAAADIQSGQVVHALYDSGLNSGGGGFHVTGGLSSATPIILRSYLAGLTLSNDATTPNTKIDVAAGMAADSTNAMMINLASAATIDFTGTGAGKLDTGSIAASTWYHCFVVAGSSGVSTLASTSLTPTLPSGYTAYRRIGSVLTDTSSHLLAFSQSGDEFLWSTSVNDVTVGNLSSTPTLYAPERPDRRRGQRPVPGRYVAGNSFHRTPHLA